jgi:hypothetical protein
LDKNRIKPVWLGFGSVFSGFARFGFGSVRFFRFQAYKTETELNLSVFFHDSVFSVIFFPVFSVGVRFGSVFPVSGL